MIKGLNAVKNADILLIICPPWDVLMPPLGISYLASFLRHNNFKPLIFDINIYLYNKASENEKKWWHQNMYNCWVDNKLFQAILETGAFKQNIEGIVDKIISTNTKILGFSINFANRLLSIEIAKRITKKDRNRIIIFGGFGCITEHMRSLVPEGIADIFVVGEGEQSLLEIIQEFKNNKSVEGTVKPGKPIMNLNTIPFPTFEESYLELFKQPILPIITSRGCISRCTFCNDHVMSFPYRIRSPECVVEEIRYHITYNNIRTFSFKDLLCNGSIEQLDKICELIINSGLEISWDSQAVPKRDMSYELLIKMKKAGCHTLIYGVESCSNKILKMMRKLFNKEDIKKVLEDTKKAGIEALVNIIVGFPGETEEDFSETLDFIKENSAYISKISSLNTCLVNDNTDLHSNLCGYGIVLPEDPCEHALRWYSLDCKNNYGLRLERAKRVTAMLSDIGLECECTNAAEA